MLKCRGDIKWQPAMMLPEYSKLLSEARAEFQKIEKPIIDEQMVKDMEFSIHEAMEYNLLTEYHYFKDGQIHIVKGYVCFIDYFNKHYRINDLKEQTITLPFDKLTAVNVLEEYIQYES